MPARSCSLRLALGLLLAAVFAAAPCPAQVGSANTIGVDPDGTFHIPAQAIPLSNLMSPELKESLLHDVLLARDPKNTEHQPDGSELIHRIHRERQDALYPVHKEDTTIGGVHVMVFTPLEGPSAKSRNR